MVNYNMLLVLFLLGLARASNIASCGDHVYKKGTVDEGNGSNGGDRNKRSNAGDGHDDVDCGPWRHVVCKPEDRDGEFPSKHKKYSIVYIPKSWYEADRYCKSLCKSLAAITSLKDQHYMEAAVDDYSINPWLGGQCSNRNCRWQNTNYSINSSSFKNWASGQPESNREWLFFGDSYKCVIFNSRGKDWSTAKCSGRRPFVCQSFV